jgi:hypothetical protein
MKKNAAAAGLTLLAISALCYSQFARDTSGGTPDEKIIQNNSAGDSLRTQAQSTADSLRAKAQGTADTLRANQKRTADSLRAQAQGKATLLRANAQGTADSALSNERGTAKSLLTKEQGTADSVLSKEQGTAQSLRNNAQGTADSLRANQQASAKSLRANAQGTADSLLSNQQNTADSLRAQSQGAADTLRANEQGTAKSLRVNEQGTAKSLQGTAQGAADTLRAKERGTAGMLRANERGTADSLRVNERETADTVHANSELAIKEHQIKSTDSTRLDMFGNLLKDDSAYNKKAPLWIPAVEVGAGLFLTWAGDRYALQYNWALNSIDTLIYKIHAGYFWDNYTFGEGFWAHPYGGGVSFVDSRSAGYNFWESAPLTFAGALAWKYFGENTPPNVNDLFTTTLNGIFYGEVLYRLSSNILDDRTVGTERFIRELGSAVLCPSRFFNRIIDGKLTRVTDTEVYQKAPLNAEFSMGSRWYNNGNSFGTGPKNIFLNAQLDYGYPFEYKNWRPFDYFTVRAELNTGVGEKFLDNIVGDGVLFGKNVRYGDNLQLLLGIFQYYDYWDNLTFELGTIGLGGGIMSQYNLAKSTYLFTNLHLAVIPFAENSTQVGPFVLQAADTIRDFNYGDGMEAKFDCGINFGWGSIEIPVNYYWINTFYGLGPLKNGTFPNTGENYIGIIKPRITVRLYHNLNIGAEQQIYTTNRYTPIGDFHAIRTEQRVYLMGNVGNFKL